MPITVKIELYTFKELVERGGHAYDKAREWLIQGLHDSWYDFLVDRWEDYLENRCGMDKVKVNFSGFWSQGDGACFHGNVVNFKRFMEGFSVVDPSGLTTEDAEMFDVGLTGQYPHLYRVLCSEDADEFGSFNFDHMQYGLKLVHSGRYSHEYSVDFDWQDTGPEIRDIDLALVKGEITQEQRDLFVLATKDFDALVSKDGLEKSLRGVMRAMYSQLKKSYEWHVADEQLIETAEANDYVFYEDGRFAGSREDHECVSESSDASAATTSGSGA